MNDINLKLIRDIILSALTIESHIISSPFENLEILDHGAMKILNDAFNYSSDLYKDYFNNIEENYIYYFKNCLDLNLVIMKVPNNDKIELLVFGPFLTEEFSTIFCDRIQSRNKIPISTMQALKSYYSTINVINELTVQRTFQTVASYLFDNFNSENQKVINLNQNVDSKTMPISSLVYSMKVLEERYEIENNLLDAVSKGDTTLALKVLSKFPTSFMSQRFENPLRTLKNTLILLSALYRKAAEIGNVHPVYIDQLSTEFSIHIERSNNMNELNSFALTMTRKYCQLVKIHSLSLYSKNIRKAINFINLNLNSPLSLTLLADNLKISPSYLSSQFKKETNNTLTSYIHQARIKEAKHLLDTENISINDVSVRVGIYDYNYFSRLFKSQTGMSPLQYLNMNRK